MSLHGRPGACSLQLYLKDVIAREPNWRFRGGGGALAASLSAAISAVGDGGLGSGGGGKSVFGHDDGGGRDGSGRPREKRHAPGVGATSRGIASE